MENLINIAHYALSFFVVLNIIVFVHEFAHYIVAKMCGVKIDAFSIGFGKEVFGWNDRSGTRWKLSLLPLGGFVKMYGDASAASNADVDTLDAMSDEEKAVTFHFKPLWQKAAVVAAGPFSNFILTIGLITYFIFSGGLSSTQPIIGEIMPGLPAEEAGLQPGDRILSIDGDEVERFNDIPLLIAINLGTPIALEVERTVNGQATTLNLSLSPQLTEHTDPLGTVSTRPLIGIKSVELHYEDVTLVEALKEATVRTYDMCLLTFYAIKQMVVGDRSVKDMKGPVGIAEMTGKATEQGIHEVLWLMALLSANLGLINLLPIPMLDGGHLAYYAAEALRGRPLAKKVQEFGFRIGFAMILTLMAFTIFNDLRNVLS